MGKMFGAISLANIKIPISLFPYQKFSNFWRNGQLNKLWIKLTWYKVYIEERWNCLQREAGLISIDRKKSTHIQRQDSNKLLLIGYLKFNGNLMHR